MSLIDLPQFLKTLSCEYSWTKDVNKAPRGASADEQLIEICKQNCVYNENENDGVRKIRGKC